MQSNTQVSFECAPCLNSLHHPVRDGDSTSIVLSSTDHVEPPKSAKKPTRQWAAWTRQEEESFFTALRQVGKNFEKITSRVQSKNKDQVRHYYYRLVRRMNKLLGPELSLDAKNSKDTIAAMLRWWSLLEKYSCKASKLHLKPRRFKVFIEALEHQLTKDKKKNVKRRHPQGESCSTISTTFTNQNKTSEEDSRSVKFILLDNQNIQKLATGKASSPKRMASLGINRSNSKGDSSAVKTSRQRRKPAGLVSSAAYKRWEKAAIAGVSLVADAAEHLERVVDDKEGMEQDIEKERFNPPGNILPSLPAFPPKVIADGNLQSSMKLKLQLFPIDEATRRALEMDKHNPHLELTLSNRKKISSVVDHLSRKWGSSSMSTGQLMLFPYSAERENLMNYQRWAIDSIISVADVYAMIGRPAIFRLRYGWMSIPELDSIPQQEHLASCHFSSEHNITVNCGNGDPISASKDELPSAVQKSDVSTYLPNGISRTCVGVEKANVVPCQQGVNVVWQKERENETFLGHTEDEESLRLRNVAALSSVEWADSLTNVSVGDLLSEATPEKNVDCTNTPVAGSSQCQQIPFTCDSFDAAIAAHLYRHQVATNFQSNLASSESSIWDAEVACDGFSFKKNIDNCQEVAELPFTVFSGVCEPVSRNNSARSCNLDEELPEIELPTHSPTTEVQSNEHPTETHFLESSVKEFGGIADMYWPDSLGPLELEVPSCRYHSEDLILSDSLCGLNNLIASSLDAFQNCSFFGIDKKEGTSMTVEGQKSAPFSDFKIGNGV